MWRKESTGAQGMTAKRHWFQFSLKTLIAIMLFVGVCMSLVVKRKQEQEAATEIQKVGGAVFRYGPTTPESLRSWLSRDFLKQIEVVNLGGERVADDDLARLKLFRQLKCLYVLNTKVTDVGFEQIGELSGLTTLTILSNQVTDAGIEHVKRLKQLSSLYLCDAKITDASLQHIKELRQLTDLELECPRITDAGLDHLRSLNQLEALVLRKTKVTDAGVVMLKQALPNCIIECSPH